VLDTDNGNFQAAGRDQGIQIKGCKEPSTLCSKSVLQAVSSSRRRIAC